MTPKLIKKTLRFFEDLIFIKVPIPTDSTYSPTASACPDIPRTRSYNDLTIESQPYEDDLNYRSLRLPKKVKIYPELGSGLPVGKQPTSNFIPTLPTLLPMNGLEDLISKTHTLCNEMERNSSEIDDLEKRLSLPYTIKEYSCLETLV